MPLEKERRIVSEGPDDLGVLRCLVTEWASQAEVEPVTIQGTKSTKRLEGRVGDLTISIDAAMNAKSGLAQPKAESFADKLLEAPETKSACLARLKTTAVWAMLDQVLAQR